VIIRSQVQTLLQRDKVVWTSGFLATPSVSVTTDLQLLPERLQLLPVKAPCHSTG